MVDVSISLLESTLDIASFYISITDILHARSTCPLLCLERKAFVLLESLSPFSRARTNHM
jgi:hypothetical protein